MSKIRVSFGLSCLVLLPLTASAQNNTPATAATYVTGQGWINVNVAGLPDNLRWYRYGVVGGHSYCAEQVADKSPTTTQDGYVEVRRQDRTTVIGAGDDVAGAAVEPGFDNELKTPGRVCYVAPATENNYVQVSNCCGAVPAVTANTYQFRVVDTTLYSPWFFSGSGYEAFILLRNTTAAELRVTVTLRSTAGVALGSQMATVNAGASYNLQVSAPPPGGFGLASASGTVEVAFQGSGVSATFAGAAGSLLGNVTTLSFGQGVSFDAPMVPRQDWQR
jgi:hypothetical protein